MFYCCHVLLNDEIKCGNFLISEKKLVKINFIITSSIIRFYLPSQATVPLKIPKLTFTFMFQGAARGLW